MKRARMNHPRSQTGFTLIEVMSAIGLFSIIAVGLSSSTIANMRLNSRGKTLAAAHALAQNKIEQIRLIQPAIFTIPADLTAGTHNDAGNPMTALDGTSGSFTRSWTVSMVPQYYNGSIVGARVGVVKVTVTVSWPNPLAGSVTHVTYACTTPTCG
jgi:prepilin-type N-terminal cleavage/methylation domain-containing protein